MICNQGNIIDTLIISYSQALSHKNDAKILDMYQEWPDFTLTYAWNPAWYIKSMTCELLLYLINVKDTKTYFYFL